MPAILALYLPDWDRMLGRLGFQLALLAILAAVLLWSLRRFLGLEVMRVCLGGFLIFTGGCWCAGWAFWPIVDGLGQVARTYQESGDAGSENGRRLFDLLGQMIAFFDLKVFGYRFGMGMLGGFAVVVIVCLVGRIALHVRGGSIGSKGRQ